MTNGRKIEDWVPEFRGLRIGELLVRKKKITEQQLKAALEYQQSGRFQKKRFGEILVEIGNITENDIVMAYAEELRLPYIHNLNIKFLEKHGLTRDIFENLPEFSHFENHKFLPYKSEIVTTNEGKVVWEVHCVICDPLQFKILYETFMNVLRSRGNKFFGGGMSIGSIGKTEDVGIGGDPLTSVSDLNIYTILANSGDITRTIEVLKGSRSRKTLDAHHSFMGDASISHLFSEICQFGISQKCSDIHVHSGGLNGGLVVHFRKDGDLYSESTFSRGSDKFSSQAYDEFVNVIFDRAKGMDRSQKERLPQDGAIQEMFNSKTYDMRIASVPIVLSQEKNDCKLTIRIHNDSDVLNIKNIGLLDRQLDTVRNLYTCPNGLLLLTGPTSSGKTTTIHAILNCLNFSKQTCYTIENPVEHLINGAWQIQVDEKEGRTTQSILRNILRQDPDIIFVGEIRDPESLDLVLQSANTGHSVFSTVHANSAYKVPQRLLNMGVQLYQLSSSLNGVISQRLTMKNCPKCSAPYTPTDTEYRLLGLKGDVVYKQGNGIDPESGHTCAMCSGKGHIGRVGIFEILPFALYPDWDRHAATSESLKEYFDSVRDENGVQLFPDLMTDAQTKMELGWISPKAMSAVFARTES